MRLKLLNSDARASTFCAMRAWSDGAFFFGARLLQFGKKISPPRIEGFRYQMSQSGITLLFFGPERRTRRSRIEDRSAFESLRAQPPVSITVTSPVFATPVHSETRTKSWSHTTGARCCASPERMSRRGMATRLHCQQGCCCAGSG